MKRWIEGGDEFLLVNRLEPEVRVTIRPVGGLALYERAFYEAQYNRSSVQHFFDYVEQTSVLVQKAGWPLERKFNKHYCGFKHGIFNAFGIQWISSKSFAFFFKLPEDVARRLPRSRPSPYDTTSSGNRLYSESNRGKLVFSRLRRSSGLPWRP